MKTTKIFDPDVVRDMYDAEAESCSRMMNAVYIEATRE